MHAPGDLVVTYPSRRLCKRQHSTVLSGSEEMYPAISVVSFQRAAYGRSSIGI